MYKRQTAHHVGVYASKKDNRIVKADYPKALLKGSPVSASIAAAIMNGKYVNALFMLCMSDIRRVIISWAEL